MGQAEQDPDLPRSVSNILGKVQYNLCLTVAGQVEVPAGQVNFRVSLPCSANNVLQPMLHPAFHNYLTRAIKVYKCEGKVDLILFCISKML